MGCKLCAVVVYLASCASPQMTLMRPKSPFKLPEIPTELWIDILLKVSKSKIENILKSSVKQNGENGKFVVATSKPVHHLCKLKLVSKAWKSYLEYDGFWFELLKISREDASLERNYLKFPLDFLRTIPTALATNVSGGDQNMYMYRTYQELSFLEQQGHFGVSLIKTGISASSEDHHTQSINASLSTDPFEFWSSVGVSDVDSDESLLYELVSPCCLVRSILLKPFLAQYQKGLPCYAPKSVSFSLGFSESELHFHSERFEMENTSETQEFVLPGLVLGSFLCIHLHGRNQNQPGDNLFYTCLESVEVRGAPGPSLKTCPLLLKSSLNYISTISTIVLDKAEVLGLGSADQNPSIISASAALDEHLQDLQSISICLDLLHNAKYAAAIDIMAKAPFFSLMRKKEFLENYFFSVFPSNKKELDHLMGTRSDPVDYPTFAHWYRYYISVLFENQEMLTGDEALLLAKLSSATGNVRLIDQGINTGLINCKLELGLMFEGHYEGKNVDESSRKELLSIAYIIYVHGRSFDKILDLSIILNNFRVVILV